MRISQFELKKVSGDRGQIETELTVGRPVLWVAWASWFWSWTLGQVRAIGMALAIIWPSLGVVCLSSLPTLGGSKCIPGMVHLSARVRAWQASNSKTFVLRGIVEPPQAGIFSCFPHSRDLAVGHGSIEVRIPHGLAFFCTSLAS